MTNWKVWHKSNEERLVVINYTSYHLGRRRKWLNLEFATHFTLIEQQRTEWALSSQVTTTLISKPEAGSHFLSSIVRACKCGERCKLLSIFFFPSGSRLLWKFVWDLLWPKWVCSSSSWLLWRLLGTRGPRRCLCSSRTLRISLSLKSFLLFPIN